MTFRISGVRIGATDKARISILAALVALLIVCNGCNRGASATVADGDSYEKLDAIGTAFTEYCKKHGRAPKQKEDILPVLQSRGWNNDVFSSESGIDFEINWGVLIDLDDGQPSIIAREPGTSSGSFLATTTLGTFRVSEGEFENPQN